MTVITKDAANLCLDYTGLNQVRITMANAMPTGARVSAPLGMQAITTTPTHLLSQRLRCSFDASTLFLICEADMQDISKMRMTT